MIPAIASISTRLRVIPLTRPWGEDVADIRIIEVRVRDESGAAGSGFAWTPTIGAEAVRALIDCDIAGFAVGRPADPSWWGALWRHLHEAGGGGITTIAMSGLDTALWDLVARRNECGVPDLLGRRHDELLGYGSGVNLHYSLAELAAQALRWSEAGYEAVKMKVGRPVLAEDVERVALVRDVVGPSVRLRVDANQRWTLDQATEAIGALSGFGLDWVEEPIRSDDLGGHVELKRRTGARLAVGENLHTRYRFAEFIGAGAADVFQPNIVRVGGITPALEIAELVTSSGLDLAFHLLPELSAQLAVTLAEPTPIEMVEDFAFVELGVLAASPVVIANGRVRVGESTGLGLEFTNEGMDAHDGHR